jgi:DNA-directed RNA polymerase specialized sigma24 family protein
LCASVLLPSKLVLHGVDVKAACSRIGARYFAQNPGLLESDREDLIAYPLADAWRMSERYAPNSPKSRFGAWIEPTLQQRCIDWRRSKYGRTRWQFSSHTYERPREPDRRLDAPGRPGDPDAGDLRDLVAARTGDPAADRDPDLAWLYADADRNVDRDLNLLRAEHAVRAGRRARGLM